MVLHVLQADRYREAEVAPTHSDLLAAKTASKVHIRLNMAAAYAEKPITMGWSRIDLRQ
jgi:hypothetical protein